MIWLFLYKLYRILTGNRPIYHFVYPGDESSFNFEYFKKKVKLKKTPREGDVIYFDEKPPYYKVIRIIHSISTFHVIFIVIEEIN
jgi:hypothetical protein